MSESQSTATVSIAEAMSSNVSRHNYKLIVKSSTGEPVAGQEAVISKAGDGSFAPNFRSDEIRRVTDDAGEAVFTWYRGGVFTRGVKATVTVTAAGGQTITIERYTEPTSELGITYVERPIRLSPPRV